MTKSDVLAKLDQFKDRPVVIGFQDEAIVIHTNVEGHWLFTEGDNLVEVKDVVDAYLLDNNDYPKAYVFFDFDPINML